MVRLVVFIFSVGMLNFATGNENVRDTDPRLNLVFQDEGQKDNYTTCTASDIQGYVREYHGCFNNKKHEDGGKDLVNMVHRILEHSGACLKNSSRKCRPDVKGFAAMMDNVIYQMRDYCHIYLEHIHKERDKIKDLQCMQQSLSTETYQGCFKTVFVEGNLASEEKFQQKVENAILCTDKAQVSCSKVAKSGLNEMVRTILRVSQPEREDLEDKAEPEPPKRWYDVLLQPFISLWGAVRSFFGF